MSAAMMHTYSGSATACADVVLSPSNGNTPITVYLSTTTSGAHIFYTKKFSSVGVDPTHTGDSATGTTLRIGSNSGTVNTAGGFCVIRALAYEPSHIDSGITEGVYEPAG